MESTPLRLLPFAQPLLDKKTTIQPLPENPGLCITLVANALVKKNKTLKANLGHFGGAQYPNGWEFLPCTKKICLHVQAGKKCESCCINPPPQRPI